MKTIGLIALAAAGLGIGYLLYTDRGRVMVGEAGDAVSDAAETVRQGAAQTMDSAKESLGTATDTAQKAVRDGIATMKRTMSDTTERVTSTLGMDDESGAQDVVADVIHQPHPDTAMAHAFEEALTQS